MAEPPRVVECPHAARCSGCALIGLDYSAQLDRKRETLCRALAAYGVLAKLEPEPTVGAETITAYRTRAKLVVAPGPRIGLYARGSHEVVDIPECRVLTPALARLTAVLRDLVRGPPADSGDVLRPRSARAGALLALDLREAIGPRGSRVSLVLVLDAERRSGKDELAAAARALMAACPELASVAVSRRGAKSPRVLGGTPEIVAGESEFVDGVDGVSQPATPGAFVQAHRGQAARIHAEIERAFERSLGALAGRRVLDLYAGSGAIGLALARTGAKVTLVESYAPAAEALRRAHGTDVEVVTADAALLPELPKPDAIVVNPPRRGLSPRVRAVVAGLAPRLVAYVSCAPDTLSRDLAAFRELGYAANRLVPVDMIPLSDQVETLALLEPATLPPLRVLGERDDLLCVDKPAHLPTTPQGEHAQSLLARVRARAGWKDAVPLCQLDAGASGACLFVRRADAVPAWRAALASESAEQRYVALVRGVTKPKGVVNRPLPDGGSARPARTRYARLAVVGGHSLVSVSADEGGKHQIRRHLAGIGHPVVGDARYGHAPTNRHFLEKYGLDRCFLHLERVALPCPEGSVIIVESPLASELASVRSRLARD